MELKYGDVSNEEATQFLNEQSLQCMNLFLLSKNYRDDLRVSANGSAQNTKGSFYNLDTLLKICSLTVVILKS